jgi:hypothetical protein
MESALVRLDWYSREEAMLRGLLNLDSKLDLELASDAGGE